MLNLNHIYKACKKLKYQLTRHNDGFGLFLDIYDPKRKKGIYLKISEIEMQDKILMHNIVYNLLKVRFIEKI